jgi:hypothetical protein
MKLKLDVKALGKAIMYTAGVVATAFGVTLLTKWLGNGVLGVFSVAFMVTLFYFVLKD